MEEMNKRELELWEMDKISGGAGSGRGVVRCSKCGEKMKSVGNGESWCVNTDCKLYHVKVKDRPAFRER